MQFKPRDFALDFNSYNGYFVENSKDDLLKVNR